MEYNSLDHLLRTGKETLAKGPLALIFVEDDVELATTMRHHLQCGFSAVLAFMPDAFQLPKDVEARLIHAEILLEKDEQKGAA